jgi:hypothetical protein
MSLVRAPVRHRAPSSARPARPCLPADAPWPDMMPASDRGCCCVWRELRKAKGGCRSGSERAGASHVVSGGCEGGRWPGGTPSPIRSSHRLLEADCTCREGGRAQEAEHRGREPDMGADCHEAVACGVGRQKRRSASSRAGTAPVAGTGVGPLRTYVEADARSNPGWCSPTLTSFSMRRSTSPDCPGSTPPQCAATGTR